MKYYFVKNLLGDLAALYRWDGADQGILMATYNYDLGVIPLAFTAPEAFPSPKQPSM